MQINRLNPQANYTLKAERKSLADINIQLSMRNSEQKENPSDYKLKTKNKLHTVCR